MSDEITEAGRQERFARWESIGLDAIKDDLRHGGIRFVGGPPQVQQLAQEWVKMKEEQAKQHPPKPPTYSRQTVIAAADMLKALGHSGFDRFLLELELPDDQTGRGSGLLARATSLAEYAVRNPTQSTPDRLTVPFAIIKRATDLWREGVEYNLNGKERGKFAEAMKREGHGLALQVGHDNLPNSIVEQTLMASANMSGMDFFHNVLDASLEASATEKKTQRKVFVVHGHDNEVKSEVARFLERIDFQAIVLHEQASGGRTIIEKVEAQGDVGFAVVLLTPDDHGCKVGGAPRARARQNVILELGYFIGRLGRSKVCALKRGDVETPSDFDGVVYETFDEHGGWRSKLAKELAEAGFTIDWAKVHA